VSAVDWVWLENPETGGRQQFHAGAAPTWQLLGWRPCEAPEVVDPAVEERDRIAAEQAPKTPSSRKTANKE
jgi:hypothetical protein